MLLAADVERARDAGAARAAMPPAASPRAHRVRRQHELVFAASASSTVERRPAGRRCSILRARRAARRACVAVSATTANSDWPTYWTSPSAKIGSSCTTGPMSFSPGMSAAVQHARPRRARRAPASRSSAVTRACARSAHGRAPTCSVPARLAACRRCRRASPATCSAALSCGAWRWRTVVGCARLRRRGIAEHGHGSPRAGPTDRAVASCASPAALEPDALRSRFCARLGAVAGAGAHVVIGAKSCAQRRARRAATSPAVQGWPVSAASAARARFGRRRHAAEGDARLARPCRPSSVSANAPQHRRDVLVEALGDLVAAEASSALRAAACAPPATNSPGARSCLP